MAAKQEKEECWNDYNFIEDHFFGTPDISFEESQRRYENWNEHGSYDKMLKNKPKQFNVLAAYREGMRDLVAAKSSVRVLDVACGTGLSGESLRELGYTDIDGLDPCEGSVEIVRKKGIFKNVICSVIGGDTPVDIPDDTYDIVCVSAAFAPGHIPCSAVPEMVRITKPGGYILNCMRNEFLETVPEYKDRLVPLLKSLENQGKIRMVEWTIYPNHYLHKDGLRMIFKVL